MKPLIIEIFRPGTHVPMSGQELTFSEADLQAIAAGYDKAVHEAPVVVGHPKTEDPAYGWVEGLSFNDGALYATLSDVEPEFAEAVNARRYAKRSPAFYGPDARGNPTPGKYYLRHLGFLGAQVPGCKGLKALPAFAEGEDEALVFAESPVWDLSWALSSIATMFRRMRDKQIEKTSIEDADAIYPDYSIVALEDAAKAVRNAASDGTRIMPAFSEPTPDPVLEARAILLDTREAGLAAREAAIAARDAAERKTALVAFAENLSASGRLKPGGRADFVAFMEQLDASELIAFGEGEALKVTMLDRFKSLVSGAAPLITFGEFGQGEDPPPQDAVSLAAAATVYITEQASKGITVRTEDAVRHVQKGTAA
ncbi:hypothetical protein sos41_31360 [Alphaproteobacteria bacterium SO-S41]|nr:hypothetical protein sos41_31360 [Alphaproteobacteria bacterium SO-S41]